MSVDRDPRSVGVGEVSAAVRARTILAICHEVWCEPDAPGAARPVGLLDVGGVPYLVLSSGRHALYEGAELTCVASTDDLGVLDFRAWLGRPRMLVRDRAAMQVFNEHRRCLQEPPGPLEDIVVVPFGLITARVVAPFGDALAVEVAPDAVDGVEPDWLLVHGSSVAAHLESAHAKELGGARQPLRLAGCGGLHSPTERHRGRARRPHGRRGDHARGAVRPADPAYGRSVAAAHGRRRAATASGLTLMPAR